MKGKTGILRVVLIFNSVWTGMNWGWMLGFPFEKHWTSMVAEQGFGASAATHSVLVSYELLCQEVQDRDEVGDKPMSAEPKPWPCCRQQWWDSGRVCTLLQLLASWASPDPWGDFLSSLFLSLQSLFFICLSFFLGIMPAHNFPYHVTSHNGDKLMGHSDLVAKAPCLRFPEPWGVSQAGWIASFWLVNLMVFAPLIAIQKFSQKCFYLYNLKPFSSYPPGQKLALLWSWHNAALSQLLFPGQTASAMCHCTTSAHFQTNDCWGLETVSKKMCGTHVQPPSLVEQGARILPKRRREIHYPCCPARTDMLTGMHRPCPVLGSMLCTQALA